MNELKENKSISFSGIYGIPEAAKVLSNTPPFTNGGHIDTTKLRYWIRTSVPYVAPSNYPTRQRLITFLDLISMRMIAVMRSRGLKLRYIRNHEKWLKREFGIKFPFVSRELWTCGSHVYMKFHDHLWASSKFGQQALEFIEGWLSKVELDMEFNEYDVASAWHPIDDVCLNPKIQFGAPCINGTRIPTRTIWRKAKAGDSEEIIANLYGISATQIEHALAWESRFENNGGKTVILARRTPQL
ncbi:DUF433 domain-containing protein [Chloroflexota bacterium]